MSSRGERLLPALSGLLLALSFPPLHLLVPPFVALVPLGLFLHDLPGDRSGGAAALRGGLLLGLVYWGLTVYWVLPALFWHSPLAAVPASMGALLVLVLPLALVIRLAHGMLHGLGLPLWLVLPVAWTGGEWIRGHLPGLAFPWLGLGTSLTGHPELVGVAELVGARGVTFWIAAVNGVLALAVVAARRGRRPVPAGVAAAVLIAAPMGWGVWRAGTLELRPAARVAVVQPNISQVVKRRPRAALDSTRLSLDRLMPRLERGSVDLVVWPEVTFPAFFEEWPELQRLARDHARSAGAPILLGALGRREDAGGSPVPLNSAFLVTAEEGLTGYRYDKHELVPVVERVPWIDPALLDPEGYFGAYGEGRGWPLGTIGEPGGSGARFGVLICFESAFPGVARAFRRAGADVLVNITNDAWYGRDVWYGRTTALWQHPAHLVMRAVENRVGVARSANTGISLFVDPVGRIHAPTELFRPEVREAMVRTTDVLTLYARVGDLLGPASGTLVMLLGLVGMIRFRRGGDGRPGELP